MSAQRFTVTHADGTQSVRTSKTMVYTYAVEVAEAGAYRAARANESAAYFEAEAAKYAALVERAGASATEADRGLVARDLERAERHRQEAEREAATPTIYGVVRWSQTREAAEKEARKRQGTPGYTATVVPVD